jgi:hypothetical protein
MRHWRLVDAQTTETERRAATLSGLCEPRERRQVDCTNDLRKDRRSYRCEDISDDRDIEGGDDIPDVLRDQIGASSEILVLMTPVSVTRTWVLLEIGAAWHAGKRIIPLCYHVDTDKIPTMLQKMKALALNDFDRYVSELQNRVGRRQ